MSIDKTLRMRDALQRHRNVLTRAQRIEELERQGRWKEGSDSPFNLPKIRVLKSKKRAKKKEKKEEAAAAPVAEVAADAAPAKGDKGKGDKKGGKGGR